MNKLVMALAYVHRYGLIAALIIVRRVNNLKLLGIILLVYAGWTLTGYLLKWEHIYCSWQNAYHEKMTPGNTNWRHIDKKDVWCVSFLFGIAGVVILVVF